MTNLPMFFGTVRGVIRRTNDGKQITEMENILKSFLEKALINEKSKVHLSP